MVNKKPKEVKPAKEKLPETPAPGIEPESKSKVSTEGVLQEQVEGWELQKYDLLEKLSIIKWQQRNMGRVWKLQRNQIFLKLDRLDNNIAVVRKQIKTMEGKMPEDDKPDEPDKPEDKPEDKPDESDDDSDNDDD